MNDPENFKSGPENRPGKVLLIPISRFRDKTYFGNPLTGLHSPIAISWLPGPPDSTNIFAMCQPTVNARAGQIVNKPLFSAPPTARCSTLLGRLPTHHSSICAITPAIRDQLSSDLHTHNGTMAAQLLKHQFKTLAAVRQSSTGFVVRNLSVGATMVSACVQVECCGFGNAKMCYVTRASRSLCRKPAGQDQNLANRCVLCRRKLL